MMIPWAFHGTQAPQYVSSTSISITSIMERSWDDTYDIISSGTTTVSMATNVLTSANLAGTVTAASGQATVTGTGTAFTTNFQVGDAFSFNGGAIVGIVLSITNATHLTLKSNVSVTQTNVTYARGGGSGPYGIYYLYVIANTTTGATEGVFSTRSVATGDTLVDLPTGYNEYRQLPFAAIITPAGVIIPFTVLDWPTNPTILYQYSLSASQAGSLQVYLGAVSNAMTNLSLATFTPRIAGVGLINVWPYPNGVTSVAYYMTDPTFGSNGQELANLQFVPLSYVKVCFSPSTRTVQHMLAITTGNSFYINMAGYTVTEMI